LIVIFGCVFDTIDELHSDFGDIGYALFVINDAVNVCVLTGRVRILIKVAFDLRNALIEAAARFDMGDHLFLLILYDCGLSDYYLCAVFYQSSARVESAHKHSHFIFYSTFALFIQRSVLSYVGFTWKVAGKLSSVL
jgi:hypothetical protein